MSSFSGLEIGLCFLFGGILLVLSAELYYLLWWKKKLSNVEDIENQHFSSSNITLTSTTLSSYTSCWKASKTTISQDKDLQTNVKQQETDMSLDKDMVIKSLGDEGLDLELMRLHNLGGPPRFLFTINEEAKEDLESERSKRGSRTRSMSDILNTLDTPILSPLASPALKVPQHLSMEVYNHHGLNPLFEKNEVAFNKIRSSPPPTFKFLRDAEEKLLKRLMQMESEKKASLKKMDQDSIKKTEEKEGSFVNLVVGKGNSEDGHPQVSTNSKVLPLDCSPSTTMASIDK